MGGGQQACTVAIMVHGGAGSPGGGGGQRSWVGGVGGQVLHSAALSPSTCHAPNTPPCRQATHPPTWLPQRRCCLRPDLWCPPPVPVVQHGPVLACRRCRREGHGRQKKGGQVSASKGRHQTTHAPQQRAGQGILRSAALQHAPCMWRSGLPAQLMTKSTCSPLLCVRTSPLLHHHATTSPALPPTHAPVLDTACELGRSVDMGDVDMGSAGRTPTWPNQCAPHGTESATCQSSPVQPALARNMRAKRHIHTEAALCHHPLRGACRPAHTWRGTLACPLYQSPCAGIATHSAHSRLCLWTSLGPPGLTAK